MKWNILIPFSEKGNNLPLTLLFVVQRSYDSALFCSPVTIKGMCCEGSSLPVALSYFPAVSDPPSQPLPLLGGAGQPRAGDGARPREASGAQTTERSRGGCSVKAWAVLEPVINAREASTLQGPH